MTWPTAGVNALATNNDATYADSNADASVKIHQQDHDTIATALQAAPSTFAPYAQPWEFRPESYGAKGDGTTDDTAAINAAVSAAVTYALAHNYYAAVVFRPVTYLVNGALAQGGSTFTNAIIPLPYVSPTTGQKVTLVMQGSRDQSALPHWNQTVPQQGGTFLKTTVAGTNDATYGEASVVGGPTPKQGYGGGSGNAWSNMLVVLDGVSVMAPQNPSICGFDFRGLAQAKVVSGSAMANATPSAMTSSPPTTQWTFGLAMPVTNNNDNCDVLSWSCEGFGAGFQPGEHTVATSIRSIYCWTGLRLQNTVGTPHGSHIVHASVEICQNAIVSDATAAFKMDIDLLDLESGGLIWDGNNAIIGTIHLTSNAVAAKADNSRLSSFIGNVATGTGIRLYDRNTLAGALATQPTVPASTTALQNGTMRDVAVTVSGGTVTGIAVDGITLGVTSGTVVVPAGKNITLTYSAAPTWKWIAL